MRCDICIPAYNESLILETSTKQVLDFCKRNLNNVDWSIILIINGSNDNSPQLAKEITNLDKKIKAVIFSEPGRGKALKKYWLQSEADIFCYMDSDLAVELDALPKLLYPLIKAEADLVIGNRYDKQSSIERSALRELSSRTYNLLARLILGHKQKDLQCGFKAVSKAAFVKLAEKANDSGWFFDTELIVWANKLKLRVAEVPVNWHETRLGKRQSKVKLMSDSVDFIKRLLELRQRLNNTVK
ncbi:MAG: glycosyltransferase [Candidatus Falkowbacteria bacterium]|nr:glycosyltransferase [Candidatus Falkowbacteria bacterium]